MPIDLEDLERLANDRPFHTVDIALASAVPALIAEIRRLRAELERRPEISPEDAARYTAPTDWMATEEENDEDAECHRRIKRALRAHAAKVKP